VVKNRWYEWLSWVSRDGWANYNIIGCCDCLEGECISGVVELNRSGGEGLVRVGGVWRVLSFELG